MNRYDLFTIIITALVAAAVGYILWQNKVIKTVEQITSPVPTVTTPILPTQSIKITTPLNSPLSGDAVISGVARLVYFEGSFPTALLDSNNTRVWQGPAIAQGEWMVDDYVPFQVTIPTVSLPNGVYTLVLMHEDPSGETPLNKLYRISATVTVQN